MTPLTVTSVTTEEGVAALRADWDRLLSASPSASIFQSWEWAMSWWRRFGATADRSLHVTVAREGTETLAIAPWVITNRRLRGVVPFRCVEFLGSETVNGDHLDFLTAPGADRPAVVSLLFGHLLESRTPWDMMKLDSVPEESETAGALVNASMAAGCDATSEPVFVCPAVELPSSWKDIRLVVKEGPFRETEYKARRLARQAEWRVSLCASADLGPSLQTLFDLHAKRWQLRDKPGAFTNPAKQGFYNDVCAAFAGRNWLRLHMLHVNGAPAAALLCFRFARTYTSMQNGFDPQWARHSVGQILLARVVEQAISEGCTRFDFLRGPEPYKYDWGAVDRARLRIEVRRRNLTNRLIRAAMRLPGAQCGDSGKHHGAPT
jgi:CelD/BcsL family acetyltransferase involved in cellulose biosynthesis